VQSKRATRIHYLEIPGEAHMDSVYKFGNNYKEYGMVQDQRDYPQTNKFLP
jgi:hypothetical protein